MAGVEPADRTNGVDELLVEQFDEVEQAVTSLKRAVADYKAGRINAGDLVTAWEEAEETIGWIMRHAWADLGGPWMGVARAKRLLAATG